MGYGDAHRLMLMQGVGIAMQRMHYSYKYMKAQKETKWVCVGVKTGGSRVGGPELCV